MIYNEFFLTQGSGANDDNAGYPLGPNDGPVYSCTDSTVLSGTPTIITDNTGANWPGVNIGDYICWDIANSKIVKRVIDKNGANITISAMLPTGANKITNVGGAFATLSRAVSVLSSTGIEPFNRLNVKIEKRNSLPRGSTLSTEVLHKPLIFVTLIVEGYVCNSWAIVAWQSSF